MSTALRGKVEVSPFFLDAYTFVPDTLESAMDWCKSLFYSNPLFVEATLRKVAHFMTDFEIDDPHVSDDEKEDWLKFYREGMQLMNKLLEAGLDDGCYGNAFVYIYFPFNRVLIDRRNGNLTEWALDQFSPDETQFNFEDLTYTVSDPRDPSRKVSFPFRDRRSMDRQRIRLRRIDPCRVVIASSHVSGDKRYIWRFEEQFTANLRKGLLAEVNDTPRAMLMAVKENKDWQFKDGDVFQLARPAVAGVTNYGWGLPPIIQNYPAVHQLQVYKKIDEQIGKDFMIPYRMISPSPQSSRSDATTIIGAQEWVAQMRRVMNQRKENPLAIMSLPYPVAFNQWGGDGKALVPKDNLEWHANNMLDSMGFPSELFHGSVEVPLAPTRIRFFERSNEYIATGYRALVSWVNQRVLAYLNREHFDLKLLPPDIADALENKQVELSLVGGGEISRATGYRRLGIKEPVKEKIKRLKEDMAIEKEQTRMQEELQQEMQAGSLNQQIQQQQANGPQEGQEGLPAQSAEGAGVTPGQALQKGQELAQKWLQMPEGDRKKDMQQVRATNPELYATAKQAMEEMRGQAESQGRQQLSQGGQPQ